MSFSFLKLIVRRIRAKCRWNFRGLLNYHFTHAKLKKSNFSPKNQEFVGEISIILNDFKANLTQLLKLESNSSG